MGLVLVKFKEKFNLNLYLVLCILRRFSDLRGVAEVTWSVAHLLCNTVIQVCAGHFVLKDAVTVSKALLKSKKMICPGILRLTRWATLY